MPFPPCLVGASLNALDSIRHGFYNRRGDPVADDLFATAIFTNRQIHGNRVRVINQRTDPAAVFVGDGMATSVRGLGLGVMTADCVPVLFADPDARVIGVAHAGWRGALAGVTDAVITEMMRLGAQSRRITCVIGPAIQAASYLVGADLKERFCTESPLPCADCFRRNQPHAQSSDDEYHFDLPRYVRMRIAHAGVVAIEELSDDTYTNEARFFSYRRNCHRGETKDGRQMSVIVLA